MPELVDRLALVLGEHLHDGHELHVTYNAMQSGGTEDPGKKGCVLRAPEQGRTELRSARRRRSSRAGRAPLLTSVRRPRGGGPGARNVRSDDSWKAVAASLILLCLVQRNGTSHPRGRAAPSRGVPRLLLRAARLERPG
jgi:hypothetical protein